MKRSKINQSITIAKKVFSEIGPRLPPFAIWPIEEWKSKGHQFDEIRSAMLGWDVTDFGLSRFDEYGRILFTMRNGYRINGAFTKNYAEKLILDPPNQKPPLHYHRSKMEDIVVRAGNIMVRLFQATPEGECSEEEVSVQIDGHTQHIPAGTIVRLEPGQSICLPPRLIHQFWGEDGCGIKMNGIFYSVSGEISTVCDDWNDNCFLDPCERFPAIEEDEPPIHYLCHEYPPS